MAKIAVLISGEWRTGNRCITRMGWLRSSGVDVYVSTWSTTRWSMDSIGFNRVDEHTVEGIKEVLPCEAEVSVMDCGSGSSTHNMIRGWLTAWGMMLVSGVEYNRVIIMRPDFYHLDNPLLIDLPWWSYDRGSGSELSDWVFGGTMENMVRLMDGIDKLDMFGEEGCHRIWYRWCLDRVPINRIVFRGFILRPVVWNNITPEIEVGMETVLHGFIRLERGMDMVMALRILSWEYYKLMLCYNDGVTELQDEIRGKIDSGFYRGILEYE